MTLIVRTRKNNVWNKGVTPLGTCIKCGRTDKEMCKGGTKKPYCKDCWNVYSKTKYNPVADRNRHIKYLYGITSEQYNEMVLEQGGKCKVCGDVPKRMNVDHDHKTGEVRGMLCTRCNLSIGLIEDDEWFGKAQNYLKNYHGK